MLVNEHFLESERAQIFRRLHSARHVLLDELACRLLEDQIDLLECAVFRLRPGCDMLVHVHKKGRDGDAYMKRI